MSHLEISRIERGYTQIWRINNGSYSNKLESIFYIDQLQLVEV